MGMNNTAQLETLDTLATELVKLLIEHQQSVAVAESCTGGLLAGALTAIPGCSAAVQGGVIAYANEVKQNLLGVPAELLERNGAVSAEVVRVMAEQVRIRCNATWGLATSGIAGPDGGTLEKPVGTVWMAMASAQGSSAVCKIFTGNRHQIRLSAVQYLVSALQSSVPTQNFTCSFEQ